MRFVIRSGPRSSEVVTGHGLSSDPEILLGGSERSVIAVLHQPPTRAMAERVAAGVAAAAGKVVLRSVPDREASKSLGVVEEVARFLNDVGFGRGDAIIAVGGGALTDLAGFVGAVYLRGVDTVLVPTTLLGAVDAAIGGKTAVNVDGKNLVGAFSLPVRVVVDIDVLEDLPLRLIREGAAEALKTGLIGDEALFALYEEQGLDAPLSEVVERALAVKVAVVNQDFTEGGRRAILNYGHTIGHAVEVVAGLSHGEAIAVGMVAAGAASSRMLGFADADRQESVIERLGLPVQAPGLDPDRVRDLMALDKKRGPAGLNMVLLRRIAEPEVHPVDDATVSAALAAVGVQRRVREEPPE